MSAHPECWREGQALCLLMPYPPSKKNNTTIKHGRRGRYVGKGDAVTAAETDIRVSIQQLIRLRKRTLFGDQDVAVHIEQRVATDQLFVRVSPMGPARQINRKTGRQRDLQNLQDTVLDAMQELVFDDDKQVAALDMRRVVG